MTVAAIGKAASLPSRAMQSMFKEWFMIWMGIEILTALESRGSKVKIRLERVLDVI